MKTNMNLYSFYKLKKLITAKKFIIRVLNTFPNNLSEHGLLQKNGELINVRSKYTWQ